jgi:hypothetical protein
MNVLPLTILFSSLLAIFFIIAFAVEWVRGRNTSLERESLLPFADDEPVARARQRRGEQSGN